MASTCLCCGVYGVLTPQEITEMVSRHVAKMWKDELSSAPEYVAGYLGVCLDNVVASAAGLCSVACLTAKLVGIRLAAGGGHA